MLKINTYLVGAWCEIEYKYYNEISFETTSFDIEVKANNETEAIKEFERQVEGFVRLDHGYSSHKFDDIYVNTVNESQIKTREIKQLKLIKNDIDKKADEFTKELNKLKRTNAGKVSMFKGKLENHLEDIVLYENKLKEHEQKESEEYLKALSVAYDYYNQLINSLSFKKK